MKQSWWDWNNAIGRATFRPSRQTESSTSQSTRTKLDVSEETSTSKPWRPFSHSAPQ